MRTILRVAIPLAAIALGALACQDTLSPTSGTVPSISTATRPPRPPRPPRRVRCSALAPCPTGIACVDKICQCTPTAEVCDGKDNDCDGSTDEGCVVTCPCGSTADIDAWETDFNSLHCGSYEDVQQTAVYRFDGSDNYYNDGFGAWVYSNNLHCRFFYKRDGSVIYYKEEYDLTSAQVDACVQAIKGSNHWNSQSCD